MTKVKTLTIDVNAFVASVHSSYGKLLHAFLRRRVRHAKDLDDLVQEVYLRLLRIGDADKVRNPLAYIYGVAAHVASEFNMRDRKSQVVFDSTVVEVAGLESEDSLPGQAWTEGGAHLEWQVNQALRQLSPKHLAILLLERREGLSHAEIANKLGLSVHTVKKYSVQALAQVRAGLER